MAADSLSPSQQAKVDALFDLSGGHPIPHTQRIGWLLATGLLLSVFGLACTAAPGGLLVLLAAYELRRDFERLDSGYLPADARPTLTRWQLYVWIGIGTVLLLFTMQAFLLATGFYATLWGGIITQVGSYFIGPPPAP